MELRVAGADVCAGLAMLDARHIAGDEQLSARLIEGVLTLRAGSAISAYTPRVDGLRVNVDWLLSGVDG
jgi:hypothetical protein